MKPSGSTCASHKTICLHIEQPTTTTTKQIRNNANFLYKKKIKFELFLAFAYPKMKIKAIFSVFNYVRKLMPMKISIESLNYN